MLIKITRTKNGEISFDENLVCSIEFLRVVLDKFGKGAVAYVVWSSDIDSEFYDLPEVFKHEQLSASCKIDKKMCDNESVKNAIKEYNSFCLNTPSGKFLAGYRYQMSEIGNLLMTTEVTLETAETLSKMLKENANLPDRVAAIHKQYQENEHEIQRFMVKGGRQLSYREKKQMEKLTHDK